MTILIKSTLRKRRPPEAEIRSSLRRLLRRLGLERAELSILLLGDRAMRTLNRRFRGKDRTTDVLSFPFRKGPFQRVQPHLLGDIVISVPAADRQARERGAPRREELDRLLIHGLLHLVGYDHEGGAAAARRMRARERSLRELMER